MWYETMESLFRNSCNAILEQFLAPSEYKYKNMALE
jgi:hypothetical protein